MRKRNMIVVYDGPEVCVGEGKVGNLHALLAGQTYPDIPVRIPVHLGLDKDVIQYVLCQDKIHVFYSQLFVLRFMQPRDVALISVLRKHERVKKRFLTLILNFIFHDSIYKLSKF